VISLSASLGPRSAREPFLIIAFKHSFVDKKGSLLKTFEADLSAPSMKP
jgi:hypothetical protein